MKIRTISRTVEADFDKDVNDLLRAGWHFHGPPAIHTVAQHSQWDRGSIRCNTSTWYHQVMKKEDGPRE